MSHVATQRPINQLRSWTTLLILLLAVSAASGVDVLTQANDTNRTGANLVETTLTTSNVNQNSFGKVFSYPVNGQVYAQPLYVSQVAFGGSIGTRNVVIIATENNNVYAFDADNQSVNGGGPTIWFQGPALFGTPVSQGNGSCGDLAPTVGITSTPVIDKQNGIIYLMAKSFDGANYHNKMHAINLYTGTEINTSWPVEIQGTSRSVTFNPQFHQCRTGLLMQNVGGVWTVYAAFTSHCDAGVTYGVWQGWIFAVNTSTTPTTIGTTPTIANIFCTSPQNNGGSIWQSGKGLVADTVGNIYCATGNSFATYVAPSLGATPECPAIDGTSNTTDKAMSLLKLSPSLTVQDFFIPAQADLNSDYNGHDLDFGSGGPLLIPGSNFLVQAGKFGTIYVLNTGSLGGYVKYPGTEAVQQALSFMNGSGDGNCQAPVYWNAPANAALGLPGGPHIYYWCGSNVAMSFLYNPTSNLLGTTPESQGTVTPAERQGGISISANGSAIGSGILWGINSGLGGNNPATPVGSPPASAVTMAGTIYAYKAENLSAGPLWTSDQNGARDAVGNYAKMTYPTIANGRVYVPTRNNGGTADTAYNNCNVMVYGLLAPWQTMATSLAFGVQPSNATGGVAIAPAVQVQVLDGNGNTVTTGVGSTVNVTISLGANPGAATLSGTTTVAAVNGVATFSNLIINNGGTGYTLVATSMPTAGTFTGQDIFAVGNPTGVAGSTTAVSGGYNVTGSGADINDPNDQFQFGYVHVSGNFDLQARVNAVLDTPPGGGAADYTKSGLMARANLNANSDNELALVFPSNTPGHNLNAGGYEYQYRDNGTTVPIHPANFTTPGVAIPVDYPAAWLRLTWNGTLFTSFSSVDGATWAPYASWTPTIAADYSGTFEIGLAVTAHNNAASATAQFRNLSLGTGGAQVPWLTPSTSAPFNVAVAGIVATPVISPPGRTYSGTVTVTLSDSTAGASIYYTLNNTTPSAASTLYTVPFTVAATTTVQAIGIEGGLANSTVASSLFTISTPSAPYGMPTRPPITPINVPASLATTPPALLSQTGVFTSPVSGMTPSPGIVPYDVINPLWSDGATKDRYIALPPGGQITFAPTGEWSFPVGTVMIKTFLLNAVPLETRLLVITAANPNNGYGITYKWNGTDAQLMGTGSPAAPPWPDGYNETDAGPAGAQVWHYPSRSECLQCHNPNAGFVLGQKTRQLNTLFTYPSTAVSDNQLRTWNYLGMFTTDIGEAAITTFQKLVAVNDTSTTLFNQVQSYTDANCSYCHRPGGVSTNWNGLYGTSQANMNLVNVPPAKGSLGIPGALLIYPQNPPLSVLYDRVGSVNPTIEMQPLAHNVPDSIALGVINQWIMSLTADPGPTIAGGFTPGSGPPGTTITITGTNLQDVTSVTIGGIAATMFTSNLAGTQLTVTVPAGAASGTVSVTTPSGTATSVSSFLVTGAGSQLAFILAVPNGTPNAAFTSTVLVGILDNNGVLLPNGAGQVTLAFGSNPSGATLNGTTTVQGTGGAAAFTNLSVNLAGTGYTLLATSPGMSSAQSNAFSIVNPPAAADNGGRCGRGSIFSALGLLTLVIIRVIFRLRLRP